MRTMTEFEAECYIKAGFFPKRCDIDSVVELQDIFGHQRYWSCIRWLYNEETSANAETLFKIIWNEDDVNLMLAKADEIHLCEYRKDRLIKQLAEVAKEVNAINKKCDWFQEHMKGEFEDE